METEVSSAPPAVLLFLPEDKSTTAFTDFSLEAGNTAYYWQEPGCLQSQGRTCCHSRDRVPQLTQGHRIVMGCGVGVGGSQERWRVCPSLGGLRQAGEKAARPAGQRPGPQWAVLGRLQTATTSELPCSSVCARGHLRPFPSTSALPPHGLPCRVRCEHRSQYRQTTRRGLPLT